MCSRGFDVAAPAEYVFRWLVDHAPSLSPANRGAVSGTNPRSEELTEVRSYPGRGSRRSPGGRYSRRTSSPSTMRCIDKVDSSWKVGSGIGSSEGRVRDASRRSRSIGGRLDGPADWASRCSRASRCERDGRRQVSSARSSATSVPAPTLGLLRTPRERGLWTRPGRSMRIARIASPRTSRQDRLVRRQSRTSPPRGFVHSLP